MVIGYLRMHSPTPPAALHFAPTPCNVAAPSRQSTDTSTSPSLHRDNIAGSFDISQRGGLRRRSRFTAFAFWTCRSRGTCRSGTASSGTCFALGTGSTGLTALAICSGGTGRPDLTPDTLRTRRTLNPASPCGPAGPGGPAGPCGPAGPADRHTLRSGRSRRPGGALLGDSEHPAKRSAADSRTKTLMSRIAMLRIPEDGCPDIVIPAGSTWWSLGRSPPGEVRRQFCSEPIATGKSAGG